MPRAGSPSPASAAASPSGCPSTTRASPSSDSTSRPRLATPGRSVSLALHPSTIIEGRVLAADTGRPIPDAVISVTASFGSFGARFTTRFRADGQGRFRINPSAGDYFRVRAIPPTGQAYLPGEAEFEWTKAAVKKEIDITLPRGVLIHGKVTEEGTGRPVPGAGVRFFAMSGPRGMRRGRRGRQARTARSSSPSRPARDT